MQKKVKSKQCHGFFQKLFIFCPEFSKIDNFLKMSHYFKLFVEQNFSSLSISLVNYVCETFF